MSSKLAATRSLPDYVPPNRVVRTGASRGEWLACLLVQVMIEAMTRVSHTSLFCGTATHIPRPHFAATCKSITLPDRIFGNSRALDPFCLGQPWLTHRWCPSEGPHQSLTVPCHEDLWQPANVPGIIFVRAVRRFC